MPAEAGVKEYAGGLATPEVRVVHEEFVIRAAVMLSPEPGVKAAEIDVVWPTVMAVPSDDDMVAVGAGTAFTVIVMDE